MKQLHIDPTYVHVTNHPDPMIPIKQLPWKLQLNVRCNAMASKTLQKLTIEPNVTMFPTSRVMLEIKGRSITHHQSSQIRREYSQSKSRSYLTYHHQWTDEFDTIDWELVHAKYIKMIFHKKLFVTKWVNKLLPLNQQRYQ